MEYSILYAQACSSMCETASSLRRQTSVGIYLQVFSHVISIWCRSSYSLSISALRMDYLDRAEAWKYFRDVPVWCAYSAPLRFNWLATMTLSHRVNTCYSYFVELLEFPTIDLTPKTSPSRELWYYWFWILFLLFYLNQYLSHASVSANSLRFKDRSGSLISKIFKHDLFDDGSYPCVLLKISGASRGLDS